MTKLRDMKLNTLIRLFAALENGKTLAECQNGFKSSFAAGFMYIKSSSLKKAGVFRLEPDPANRRRKLIVLTGKGRKLKTFFRGIGRLVQGDG